MKQTTTLNNDINISSSSSIIKSTTATTQTTTRKNSTTTTRNRSATKSSSYLKVCLPFIFIIWVIHQYYSQIASISTLKVLTKVIVNSTNNNNNDRIHYSNYNNECASSFSSSICSSFFPTSIPTSIFYPKEFFENGIGKQFIFKNSNRGSFFKEKPNVGPRFVLYHRTNNYYNANTTTANTNPLSTTTTLEKEEEMTSITTPTTATTTTTTTTLTERCYNNRNKVIYYHIHKNGGTTMARTNFPYYKKKEVFYIFKKRQLGKEVFLNTTSTILNQVYNSQQQQQQQKACSSSKTTSTSSIINTIPTFTFIRDPIIRFSSSLGQAIKQKESKFMNCSMYAKTNRYDFIDCILNKMETKQSYLDEHLEPQSYELYRGIQGYNISIYLIDMNLSMYNTIEHIFGIKNATLLHKKQSKSDKLVFNKFLLDKNLSYHFKERICKLYEMDVLMIKETNITTTLCL